METPHNEREQEQQQVIGAKPRKRSSKVHHATHKNTNTSSSSSSHSNSTTSDTFSSFEHLESSMDIHSYSTNDEKPQIIEGLTSVIDEEYKTGTHFEEPINNRVTTFNVVALNGESNGFTKELNGDGIVEYPLLESNGKEKETENGVVTFTFSESLEPAVGLKYVESLLDESSNGINGAASEIYNADNIVNKTLLVSDQSEIVEAGGSQEVELEPDVYEVERVIRNQKTNDLFCPYCNHDITERVILTRRKRKFKQISRGEEDIRKNPGEDLDVDERKPEDKSSQIKGSRDGSIDAISCFSCFSIFIPKGNGFLRSRFKPNSAVTSQTDTSQLSRSQYSIIPDTDPELPTSSEPVEVTLLPPTPESPVPVTLTPYKDKPPSPTRPYTVADHDGNLPSKTSISATPSTETPVLQPRETQPVTPAGGTTFPFWFVTCCQPSGDSNEAKHSTKQEEKIPSHESEIQTPLEGGAANQHHDDTKPPSTQSINTSVSEPPIISDPCIGETILTKTLPPIKPDNDIPSPPEPEAPPTPPKGEQQPITQPSVTPPITTVTGPRSDIEQPSDSREPVRAGVSGLDVIKAIIYGGLLECIASLSVITSAAGGDATTLNIVALGLANVCGGLVVLLHNLRVLKNEHATEQYTEQLGRPGHFLLHAFFAILSYLTFGLMSPIIYGFTFRKSDNKDYKIATLASASLLCITILSIGKAYVQRPPKTYFQTVFYYISMGFMVSGVGYVAGDLINMFLKKLGVFDSRADPAAVNGAWATY